MGLTYQVREEKKFTYVSMYKDSTVLVGLGRINKAHLEIVTIFEKYRHNGYGTALVKFILSHFSIKEVELVAEHPFLKDLYESYGFEEYERTPLLICLRKKR